MKKPRNIQYFFPLFAPLLLACADYFIGELSEPSLLNAGIVYRKLGVSLIFGCFIIDIWGITTSIAQEDHNNNVTISFVFLIILHLALYGFAVYIDKHIYVKSMSGLDVDTQYILLLAMIIISLLALILGREFCWRRILK